MLEFNPIPSQEYAYRAKKIATAFAASNQIGADDLVSESVFGASGYDTDGDRPLQQYHMRGFIDLSEDPATPIINPVIAGLDGALLAKILGMKAGDMKSILNFDVVSDGGELVPVDEVPEEAMLSQYRIGPQIVEDMIKRFDINASLMQELTGLVMGYLKYAKARYDKMPGRIRRGKKADNAVPLIGDYYFYSDVPMSFFDRWFDYLEEKYYTNGNTRAAYLYALADAPDGRERLESCIMTRIMVTPINTRPATALSKFDPLTKDYAEVFKLHTFLTLTLRGYGKMDAAISSYRSFINACNNLLYTHSAAKKNNKAILERLKTKHGHIRDKMLGKRVDFSGRSVITIAPFMSIRDIGIPQDMLPKIYRSAILRSLPAQNRDVHQYVGTKQEKVNRCLDRIRVKGLLEDIKVITGRQPTLHKLSMRAFHPVAVPGRSIQLNPLCVVGFNADFDGDQMYVRVPTTEAGIREANELMSIEQNMFTPKNGECSVMPRQEIIYGLNVCTLYGMKPSGSGGSFKSHKELIDALKYQRVTIDANVSCNGISGCAGRVAFMLCWNRAAFTNEEWQELSELEVTASSIKPFINKLVRYDSNAAIDCIDAMVLLGFTVSGTYPPTLNLLDDEDVDYSQEMEDFHAAIAEDADLYARGWETEAEYDVNYTNAFEVAVDKKVKANVETGTEGSPITRIECDAGVTNGFVRMSRSGARGSLSNLLQLYGYKGRVQDGSTGGSFRAVIEHSYAAQLTPLEHFITAYGGRAGLIQKSLSTADSGYTMRKMWHTSSPYVINNEDCGTDEGLTVSLVNIQRIIGCDQKTAAGIFVDMVTGRYLAQPKTDASGRITWATSKLVTEEAAKAWAKEEDCSVVIRSILTCKNPCCKKCYGIDLSTNRVPAIGLPIGFIAAQSIGEPGTQLNMDAFKKGGVASGASSSRLRGFAKLTTYTEVSKDFSNLPSYDPIAWADGEVLEHPKVNGTKSITIKGSRKSVTLPMDVPVKQGFVHRGEGLRELSADQNVAEIAKYDSLINAQRYLCYALYDVYREEGAVNLKHLEVLAYSMTMAMVITTDRSNLVPGQWHDMRMLHEAGDLSNTTYFKQIHSISKVPVERPYALSRIVMENVRDGLASSMLLGLKDPLTYPLNRIMMGKKPWTEEAYSSGKFMQQRRV